MEEGFLNGSCLSTSEEEEGKLLYWQKKMEELRPLVIKQLFPD